MSYDYYVVVDGLSPSKIGLVVRCKDIALDGYSITHIVCDDSVDFDAINSNAVKRIKKEEYDMFRPRNKVIYDFRNKVDA